MDTVIKGFLGVFIFAMIVYLSAGLISAEMDTHAARSYMDSAKKEIAESNMSPTVITAVQEQAARNGYQMQITTYGDVSCATARYIPSDVKEQPRPVPAGKELGSASFVKVSPSRL